MSLALLTYMLLASHTKTSLNKGHSHLFFLTLVPFLNRGSYIRFVAYTEIINFLVDSSVPLCSFQVLEPLLDRAVFSLVNMVQTA